MKALDRVALCVEQTTHRVQSGNSDIHSKHDGHSHFTLASISFVASIDHFGMCRNARGEIKFSLDTGHKQGLFGKSMDVTFNFVIMYIDVRKQ